MTEDTKETLGHIKFLLGQIQRDTHKMVTHIDRVEKHISWVEKIAKIIFPSLCVKKTDEYILDSVV